MSLYIQHGDDIGTVCNRAANETVSRIPIDLVTVLRDPAERFLSQLYFFSGAITEHFLFTTGQNTVSKAKQAKRIHRLWERMLKNPHSMSSTDMKQFLEFLKKKEAEFFFPRLSLTCYETVLSQQSDAPFLYDENSLARATVALGEKFVAVGTMEHMSSFFVYLALEFSHPISDSCFLHNRHEQKRPRYAKPKVSTLQPDIMSTIRQYVTHDTEIWAKAKSIHEQQLRKYNHTIVSATKLWKKVCSKVKRKDTMVPRYWMNDERSRPSGISQISTSVNSSSTVVSKTIRAPRTGQNVTNAGTADKAGSYASFDITSPTSKETTNSDNTFKNLLLCLGFTACFFYCMSFL